jgi:competence protein ComEC
VVPGSHWLHHARLFAALAGVAAMLWVVLGRCLAHGSSPARKAGQGVEITLAFMALFLILGAWRYHAHPYAACPTPDDLAFYNGDDQHAVWVTAEGVVTGYPDVRDVQTLYRLRVDALTVAGLNHPVRGDLLVQAARFPAYAYGDRLRVTGQLQTPPILDDFDYRAYLSQRDIHSLMRRARVERVTAGQGSPFWTVLYGLKARGAALLNRVLPEPAAALANGMLLGIESGIPPDVDEAFKATGTTHVIVISGSNIALLSGVLMAGLSRLLGKRRAAFPAVAGIALYVLLVGADAAALRAGLMGILYVFAIYLGRQSTAYVSLCASAFFMTLFNPLTLWDIGFQLSFMATLGLILFTHAIEARFEQFLTRSLAQEQARRVMGILNDALIVTLAAQVTTLPVIVYYFGRVSLISLVTNFLILPAQPPIMTGGMATLVAGLAWEPLGRALGIIPWLFLTYTTAVVRLTAAVPLASVETGALGRAAAVIYFAVLFGMMGWRQLQRQGWVTIPARRAIGWAAALAAPLWLASSVMSALPDGKLHLWFVPGGGTEATLIVTPGGQQIWIWDGRGDASTGSGDADAALVAATRPLLRDAKRGVDAVVGPRATALWPGAQILDPALLAPGTSVRLDADVVLTRLAAENGWALKFDRFRAILPATLKPEAQTALLAAGADLRVTMLRAPGPDTGVWPTSAFLTVSAPQMILWPEDTTYPPDVAELLAARGAIRVPAEAVVEVITDGERLWLQQRSGSGRR